MVAKVPFNYYTTSAMLQRKNHQNEHKRLRDDSAFKNLHIHLKISHFTCMGASVQNILAVDVQIAFSLTEAFPTFFSLISLHVMMKTFSYAEDYLFMVILCE